MGWGPRVRDYSRFDNFLDALVSDVYAEPLAEPGISITRMMVGELVRDGIFAPGMTILDVGCGNGTALELFKENNIQAVGITLGSDYDLCRSKGLDVHPYDQNFTGFADQSFDGLWCRHVLEHSVAPLFTLAEYRRLTKAGGHVYVEVPAPDTSAHHEANPNHYSVFGLSQWTSLMQRTGFTILRSVAINFEVKCGPDTYYSFLLRRD